MLCDPIMQHEWITLHVNALRGDHDEGGVDVTTIGFTCPRCRCTTHHPTDRERGYCPGCHDWTGAGARLVGGALHGTDVAVRAGQMPAALMEHDPDGPYRRTGHRHVTGALVYVARVAEVMVHQMRFLVPLPAALETHWQVMGRYGALYGAQLDQWAADVAAIGWQPVDGPRLSYVPGSRGPVAMLAGLVWRPALPVVTAGELGGGAHAAV